MAAVTPGSGFVAPWAAMIIGSSNGILANVGCRLKHFLGIDDALDTFGVHGIGGFYGNIVAGIFAQKWIANLDGLEIEGGWVDGNWMQVPYQLAGSFAGAIWSFCWTYAIAFTMQKIPFLRLRLDPEEEEVGDMAEMGEGAPHSYPAPKGETDHLTILKLQNMKRDSSVTLTNENTLRKDSTHKEPFARLNTAKSIQLPFGKAVTNGIHKSTTNDVSPLNESRRDTFDVPLQTNYSVPQNLNGEEKF